MPSRAGNELQTQIAATHRRGYNLDYFGTPKRVLLNIFYKVNQFTEIFIPFLQLFLFLALGLLTCRHAVDLLLVFTIHISQIAAEHSLLVALGLDTGVVLVVILERTLESTEPALAIDLHLAHRLDRVGNLLREAEQRHLLVLQRIDLCLALGNLLLDILLDTTHISRRHGERVTTRHHRHIDGTLRRHGEDETLVRKVAIHPIDHQSYYRAALAHLHAKLAVVGEVGTHSIDKTLVAHATLQTRQIDLRHRHSNGGHAALLDPVAHHLGRDEVFVLEAVRHHHRQAMHRRGGTMKLGAAVEEDHEAHDQTPQHQVKEYFQRSLHYAFLINSSAMAWQYTSILPAPNVITTSV